MIKIISYIFVSPVVKETNEEIKVIIRDCFKWGCFELKDYL